MQVGSIFAKTLALLLAVPCYGINHLDAHLLAATINNDQPLLFPALGLVVSGGHTQLVLMTSYGQIKVLSATTDDACGEALDKIGRALNFSYPGGIAIAQAAACARKHRTGTPLDRYQFSAPEITHDFSFSGFKTAALQKIPRQPQAYPEFCLALEG